MFHKCTIVYGKQSPLQHSSQNPTDPTGDAHCIFFLLVNKSSTFFHSHILRVTYLPTWAACTVARADTHTHTYVKLSLCFFFFLTHCLCCFQIYGTEKEREGDWTGESRLLSSHTPSFLKQAPLLFSAVSLQAFMDLLFPVWIINYHFTSPDRLVEKRASLKHSA